MTIRRILIICWLSICSGLGCLSIAQWTPVGSSPLAEKWTVYNDIAVDTNNTPVVVLNEDPGTIKCLKFTGVDWQDVSPASFNFPFGGNSQLRIDPVTNTYYISFTDKNNYYTSVIKYNGTEWSYAGSQYMVNQFVTDFVMAIDNEGVLHAGFISATGFQLYKETGNTWQKITTTGLPGPIAHIAMTFDKQNNLLLAFTNMNNLKAGCMKLNGTAWQYVGNEQITSGAFAQYNKIQVSEENEIYIATVNLRTSCYKLDLSGSWKQVGTSGLGYNYFGIDDLVINADNQPVIITTEFAGGKASCVYFNGNNWIKSCGSDVSDTTASSSALAADAYGTLYVMYNDYVRAKTYVRKCASTTGIAPSDINTACKIYPNPIKDILRIDTKNSARIAIYSLTGQLLFQTGVQENITDLDLSHLPGGVYIVCGFDPFTHKKLFQQKVVLIR